MKKIFLNTIVLSIYFSNVAFSQIFTPQKIQSEIQFLSMTDKLNELRSCTAEFLLNKKTKKNEVKLTINRLLRNVKLRFTESVETDTVRYDGESLTVDTDDPVPKGEHHQSMMENMVTFIGKTVSLQENEAGVFEGLKVKPGTPNISAKYTWEFPVLNKSSFLTPLLLNFNPMLVSQADTLISEAYNGIFVTNYTKTADGYDLMGKLIPLKTLKLETDPNTVTVIYEYFNYSGKIKTDNEKIEDMTLNVQEKSRTIFNKKDLYESKERNYKIVVKNTKIE